MSLRERLTIYLRKHYPNYINGAELEDLVRRNTTYKPSNTSRRLREMASGNLSDGRTCEIVAERKENERGQVMYRATKPKEVVQFTNEDGKIVIINKY